MTQQSFPRQFGKYVLMRKIAMGGMAEIFKAKTAGAEGFEKEIVIKRILPHFTEDESFVKMFIDEATITSKLQHANIVQIFDFDMCEGSYYIAMEYVEGVDLKRVIEVGMKEGRPLSVAQCVWILMELSKGLHYAHTKEHKGKPLNIVHRDISPHNAMVSFSGEIKLMDFGIAKAAQRSTKTMAGTVKGKVAYMSPEQARGKPLDGRSDLFALGIMLWEMLTHKRLFLADSDFETLTNVLKSQAPPPSSINKDVPPEIDRIVLKALEKDRDDRYSNVEAFNRELTRWYYSTVMDLEKEALKPFMHELFAEDIARNRQLVAAERGLGGGGGAASEPEPVADPDKTLAMPAASDPQAAETLLDDGSISQDKIRDAIEAQKKEQEGGDKALAMPVGTGTYTQQGYTGTYAGLAPPERNFKGILIALIVLLLLGGGGFAAWYLLTQGDDTSEVDTEGTQGEAEAADLTIEVDPPEASVAVDGAPFSGPIEVQRGSEVIITANADGYEPYRERIRVEELSQQHRVEMARERVEVTAVVQVDGDAAAEIYFDGEKAGVGTVPLKGRAGDTVEVEIRPSAEGATPFTRTLTLDTSMETVIKIPVQPEETGGKLLFEVDPSDATVEASKGEVREDGDGAYVVEGLAIGDEVELKISRSGYDTETTTFGVAEATTRLDPIELSRRRTGGGHTAAATGEGEVVINANPWANIAINGRPYGTTPKKVQLDAGRHTIVLSKGERTETKVVTVKANGSVRVTADLN